MLSIPTVRIWTQASSCSRKCTDDEMEHSCTVVACRRTATSAIIGTVHSFGAPQVSTPFSVPFASASGNVIGCDLADSWMKTADTNGSEWQCISQAAAGYCHNATWRALCHDTEPCNWDAKGVTPKPNATPYIDRCANQKTAPFLKPGSMCVFCTTLLSRDLARESTACLRVNSSFLCQVYALSAAARWAVASDLDKTLAQV